MITLYLRKNDPLSMEILETAKKLVLAHKVIYEENKDPSLLSVYEGIEPPLIIDDDKVISGIENIKEYFESLSVFLEEWQKFQSDSCYCDENGNII